MVGLGTALSGQTVGDGMAYGGQAVGEHWKDFISEAKFFPRRVPPVFILFHVFISDERRVVLGRIECLASKIKAG